MLGALGLIGGALTRLLPEAVNLIGEHQKRKEREADREHELRVLQLQMEREKMGHTQQMEAINTQGEIDLFRAGIEATKPISGQLKTSTGVRFIDGTVALLGALVDVANAAVRPALTLYWVIGLYSTVKYAQYAQMRAQGAEWDQAALTLWSPLDEAVTASIIGFWFTDRVLRHYKGK